MDPKHSADMHKHLEKQGEVLLESYRAMSHELHRLQVEEEMLMKKLYELMSAQGLIKKKEKVKYPCEEDMQDKEKGYSEEDNSLEREIYPFDEDMQDKEMDLSEHESLFSDE